MFGFVVSGFWFAGSVFLASAAIQLLIRHPGFRGPAAIAFAVVVAWDMPSINAALIDIASASGSAPSLVNDVDGKMMEFLYFLPILPLGYGLFAVMTWLRDNSLGTHAATRIQA
ncbi:MAG: hypothetical protein E2586_20715 [Novosphingobium sp.]|uniref:hypothetical protein n=1 Tax=Novosphingobium sp. TaxID=1874826 RepID=UPI0012C5D981|nr:hypothetical protein [Novosphingobium sp.]MPS70904.1 hypothetical protein [Novosphingobium sp.]